jgi:hypothetical protein
MQTFLVHSCGQWLVQVQRTHEDDEYAHAGETDPKVLITTSRSPSSRLVQFSKVRAYLFLAVVQLPREAQLQEQTCACCSGSEAAVTQWAADQQGRHGAV